MRKLMSTQHYNGLESLSKTVPIASGQPPYLLFLKQRTDGKCNTSRCDGSRILGDGLTTEERGVLNKD